MNRAPLAVNEWCHCYNRGVDKRIVFANNSEYERFLQLLYIANDTEKIHRSDFLNANTEQILQLPRSKTLVEIGALCLMNNHFHLLLKTQTKNGISIFMRKLMTGYTMYFNIKHGRTGNLFMKPFKSRRITDDRYFQRVIQYIHCNPAELFDRDWKTGKVKNYSALLRHLIEYPYSSFAAFHGNDRLKPVLGNEVFSIANQPPPKKMLMEAAAYYQEKPFGKVSP